MISEAYFHNLATMRRAAANSDIGLVVTRLRDTGEYVAAAMARMTQDHMVHVVPFGMLAGPGLVSKEGRLTPEAKGQWKMLVDDLSDTSKQGWFAEKDGRVSVRLAEGMPQDDAPYTLILAWDNPYEIFEDPTTPNFY